MSSYNYSMKWHKFLVNFLLFLGAGMNIITGLAFIFGVYDEYYLPESFGYVFGLISIGLAVIGIIARQKLASFSSDGPKWVTIVYASAMGYDILYYISYWMVTEDNAFTFFSFLSLVARVSVLLANMSYYENRAVLFTGNSSDNNQQNNNYYPPTNIQNNASAGAPMRENRENENGGNGMVVCHKCGTKQMRERDFCYCYKCGTML